MRETRIVRWIDAVYCERGEPGLSQASTVGFLIEEDDESILIAMETHIIDGDESFRYYSRIPKISITEIEE